MFRIVMEKVGDIAKGYRVQKERWSYGDAEWVRVGRRYDTLEGARDFRKYLESVQSARFGMEYTVIE